MAEECFKSEKELYRHDISKKVLFLVVVSILLVIVSIMSCAVGSGVSFSETFGMIIDHIRGVTYDPASQAYWDDYYICQNILPGVFMALTAGAGLSLAGAVMQNIMNNPLADSYTTGISSGACFGAGVAIVLGFTFGNTAGGMGIMINAFIGAMIPSAIIILLTKYVGNSPATVILIGTALSFFFNAMLTLLMVSTDAETLKEAFVWQIGSTTRATWSQIPPMLILVTVGAILVELVSKKMNVLSLGERTAKSLGMDVAQFRMLLLILLSILVASIIAFTGVIGFIGLVAPHIARYILGGDNKFVVPGSILIGALILVFADAASRALYAFGDVPIGVVMSFIGAPIFLYLIVRRKSTSEVF